MASNHPRWQQYAIRSCFEQHGLVLLQDVISTTVLGSLVPRLEEDVLRQLLDENGRVTWTRDMKAPGHYGTLVPKCLSYMHPDIHANRWVEEVVESLLGGPGFFMVSAGGNCALPGSGTQWLHTDGSHI
eukprot:COSAG01_NODE_4914_length_4629_cov_110.104636_1_plen_129_part_00